MQDFKIEGNIARIDVDNDGHRVTVTVERKDGGRITESEATLAYSEVLPLLPQRSHTA